MIIQIELQKYLLFFKHMVNFEEKYHENNFLILQLNSVDENFEIELIQFN